MKPGQPQVLVIARLEIAFNRQFVGGVMAFARERTDWDVICRPAFRPEYLKAGSIAGLLVTGGEQNVQPRARAMRIPLVMVGGAPAREPCSRVMIDNRKIAAFAVEHFCGLGLKHLGYIGHGRWPFVQARLEGFLAEARAQRCETVHQLVGSTEDSRGRARFQQDLEATLRRLPLPCGVMAADDDLGVLIVKTCRRIGLRVPEDIAVVGVDDDQFSCSVSEVPLSSVVLPLHALGYEAARMLLKHMQTPGGPELLMLPPLRVATRASSDSVAVADEDVAAALRLIRQHLSEPISVDWIAGQLPVARRTLYRKFGASLGRTIHEHIRLARIQRARELLADTDLTVDAVAQRSGFANARWMADCFRRDLHMTPSSLRRALQGKG